MKRYKVVTFNSYFLNKLKKEKLNSIATRRQIDIFTMALESAANAMMITDREGKIWWANPAFCQLTGYSWFEILGQNPSFLKSGIHPKSFYEELWQKILSGNVWKGEIINKRKDGSIYAEEMTITPIKDELGELSNFIGIKEDITQRKQSESILHRYRLLSEHANDILLFVRPDGQILEVNEAAVKAYGYSHEDLLKLKIADLSSPDQKGVLWTDICSAGEAGILLETVHCRKNGSQFPVEASAIGSRISGEWVVLAILRDISERKEAEIHLKEARVMVERAERLASLGTMVTGIAHEINQPLNSLKVTADSMLYWHKKGKQIETEKIMDNIRKISAQAERIDGIIKHMRSFVRSGQPSELTACNLKDVVEGALSLIGNQLASHGITVNKNLGNAVALGETTRLEEVVINLLVNAMQSIGQSLKQEKTITCITSVEDKIILEISDTGIGIEEELIERIFEPFFTTKPVGEGTGLGLSIVHTIVTSYKGRIMVFNNQSGGATFRVEFPIPLTEGVG